MRLPGLQSSPAVGPCKWATCAGGAIPGASQAPRLLPQPRGPLGFVLCQTNSQKQAEACIAVLSGCPTARPLAWAENSLIVAVSVFWRHGCAVGDLPSWSRCPGRFADCFFPPPFCSLTTVALQGPGLHIHSEFACRVMPAVFSGTALSSAVPPAAWATGFSHRCDALSVHCSSADCEHKAG